MDAAANDDLVSDARVLGEQERMLHYMHNYGGLLAATTLHVRGPLDEALLRRGLEWLQRRHAMLRAHIRWRGFGFNPQFPFMHRRYWFVTKGTTEIPLRFVDGDWEAVLQEELRTIIPSGRSPRMRVTVVRGEGDLNRIILLCDHSIGDAQAAMLGVRDLLTFLSDPDRAPLANDSRLPPALESSFTPSSDPKRKYEPAIRLPVQRVKAPPETRYEQRTIPTAAKDAIHAAARAHRTTLNGVVSAAVLKAVGDHFKLDAMTCLTNGEFRKLMQPPLPNDTYGCYIAVLRTSHRLDQPFWALAKEVSYKLVATVAKHQQQASVLQLPTLDQYRYETIPTIMSDFALDGVSVTTAGTSGLVRDYGPFTLEDMTVAASLHPVGTGLYVVAFEFQDTLHVTLCYGARRIHKADVAAIADLAAQTLRQLPAD